jgi:hypothetical protein
VNCRELSTHRCDQQFFIQGGALQHLVQLAPAKV